MRIEYVCYSETLDSLVIVSQIPKSEFRNIQFSLTTEFGEDPVNKPDLKQMESNLKLHLIAMETVCD